MSVAVNAFTFWPPASIRRVDSLPTTGAFAACWAAANAFSSSASRSASARPPRRRSAVSAWYAALGVHQRLLGRPVLPVPITRVPERHVLHHVREPGDADVSSAEPASTTVK